MSGESGKTRKIFCVNCINCKVLRTTTADGQKIEKIRCAAGHWMKKLGGEKLYKYSKAALKKTRTECPDYDDMGDERPFIKELKRILPLSGGNKGKAFKGGMPSSDDSYPAD